MIGRTFSHYRILEKIGAGGMGEVYLARDTRLERDVAVKLLPSTRFDDEEARKQFRREALALSKLNHPNVQTVFDFDSEDGTDFLVTEYVPGVTLSDKLTGEGLPEAEVLELGSQLAAGLAAAHAQGIVHRDLKPGNLRVMPDGRLKILDFGLAKYVGPIGESATTLGRLETNTFAGTPRYMSPEQRAGVPADARSDLYSTGLVLRELATGQPEAGGKISPRLQRVISKCLEEDREKRYASADELLEDIHRLRRPIALPTIAAIAAFVAVLAGVAAVVTNVPSRTPTEFASIVALPSDVLGSEAAFLTDAVPKTISTYLSQVDGLETKLPPTRVQVEPFGGDLDRLAATYGVNAFVLSTVTAHGDTLVLNVQLVDAEGRRLLWSHEYEGTQSGYLELVRQAAEELRQQLRPEVAAIEASAEVASSSQAELAFQEGLYYSNRFNNLHHLEDVEAALNAFQEALSLDPSFADAAAEIAWLHEFKMEAGHDPGESIAQMDLWARKALEIDRDNGRAWALRTNLEGIQGNEGAHITLNALRAVRFAPRFSRSHIVLWGGLGSASLSFEAARESARLDPLYLYAPLMSAISLADMGQIDEALLENEKALAIEPDFSTALLNKIAFLQHLGRLEDAERVLARLGPMVADGRVNPEWFGVRRDTHLVLQAKPGEAKEAFDRLRRLASGENRFAFWQLFASAPAHALEGNGRIDEARELFVRLDDVEIAWSYDSLMLSPDHAWIRDDPSLAPIIAKSKQRFEETLAILEDARSRGELPRYLEQPLDELLVQLDLR